MRIVVDVASAGLIGVQNTRLDGLLLQGKQPYGERPVMDNSAND